MNPAAHDLLQLQIKRTLDYRKHWRGLFTLSGRPAPRFVVDNSGLTIVKGDKTQVIPFYQIRKIEFRNGILGGSFALILQDGSACTYSMALERNEYILDALAIAQPLLESADRWAELRRAAILGDHFYARAEDVLKNRRYLMLTYGLLPLLLGGGLALRADTTILGSMLLTLALFALNILLALAIWLPIERRHARRRALELIENPLNPLRDMKDEWRWRLRARVVHALVASVALLGAIGLGLF